MYKVLDTLAAGVHTGNRWAHSSAHAYALKHTLAQLTGSLAVCSQRTKLLPAALSGMPVCTCHLARGVQKVRTRPAAWRGTHLAAPPQDVQLVQAACCCLAGPGGQHQGRAGCGAQAAQHRAPPAARCRCVWRSAAMLAAHTTVLTALVPVRATQALCKCDGVACKQQAAACSGHLHYLSACLTGDNQLCKQGSMTTAFINKREQCTQCLAQERQCGVR